MSKNIIYYNKELRDNKTCEEINEDSYEIEKLMYQVSDEKLDYWLNIIKASYGEFGEVTVEKVETEVQQPTELELLKQQISDLENYILQKELQESSK